MVSQLQCSQVRYIETINNIMTLELFFNMLGTELGLNPKIKVVTLVKYYNFYLGHTVMQTF